MNTYQVFIYRDGGWFRKYKEEWIVIADSFYNTTKGGIVFESAINGSKCNGMETIAEFKAEKYSVCKVTNTKA